MSEQPTPDYVTATAGDLLEVSPSALDALVVALADAMRLGAKVRLDLTLEVTPPTAAG